MMSVNFINAENENPNIAVIIQLTLCTIEISSHTPSLFVRMIIIINQVLRCQKTTEGGFRRRRMWLTTSET